LIGKALDHPDTLAYLANEYGKDLDKGIAWLTSGRSVVVRYEALHADPHGELTRATAGISPVGPDRIANAIAVCQAESLLKTRPGLHRRIRAATAGDWRNHLSELHLAIMRDRHGERIRALGYDVQDVVL
jgi:hypothetical protein